MEQKLYYARDFGAVGDGITDDGPALSHAFREAAQNEGKLILDAGKTYNIQSAENSHAYFTSPFCAGSCRNFAVDGQGAVLSVRPGLSYLVLTDCSDFTVENLSFDLSDTVYYVGTVTEVNGCEVTFETDTPVRDEGCDFNGIGFTIRYNEGIQLRPHRFFREMIRLDDHHVRIGYRETSDYLPGDMVYLPAMHIGHMYGEPVYLAGNSGRVVLRNINLWQAPSFGCAIKGNSADITFDRFCFVPSPRYDHRVKMVGWRDGFHCKDNRGAIHWENCTVGVIFDDVFNISATLGEVTEVISPRKIAAVNQEFYRHQNRIVNYYGRTGDTIEIYHTEKDTYSGIAEITAMETDETGRSILTLDRDLPSVEAGCVIGNRSSCAPGSTVRNCSLTGTMRFRGSCTIEDTEFDLLRIWIMVEGDVEGPVPGDIRFRRCVFNSGSIEVWAYNRPKNRILSRLGSEIRGIVFEDCVMDTQFDMAVNVRLIDSRASG
ncbi:MAG: hypothetical protein E7658_09915 [Ruminococcaceae bacterium]|nr:hypothetical protein [Oscillospiraceae bacterium]